jgi:hypothetical protein
MPFAAHLSMFRDHHLDSGAPAAEVNVPAVTGAVLNYTSITDRSASCSLP